MGRSQKIDPTGMELSEIPEPAGGEKPSHIWVNHLHMQKSYRADIEALIQPIGPTSGSGSTH